LLGGASLDDLGLPTVEGRIDLRRLAAPEPSLVRQYVAAQAHVTEMGDLVVLRGIVWTGMDFSKAQLVSLRFMDSRIEDCRFDGAKCQDWRIWGTNIVDTSFRGADLRKSALGGIDGGKRNAFERVDFSEADLRQTAHVSSDMTGCQFVRTKLAKVDFQGTVFTDCLFEGTLNEVLFYRHAFRGEAFPANEMNGVDLRRTKLVHVEFRGLDMNSVAWPEDAEHVVLDDYPATLDRWLTALKARTDLPSKQLAVILGMKRKWAGPNQHRGVVSYAELRDIGGEPVVKALLDLD
ncbi:MAG TPA: pentapeptide repeat-containing protein, partial [Polyangiaceae bacterium]|nr:pentapeptide repeat-containing protein [Polyangiaceae bacterium]